MFRLLVDLLVYYTRLRHPRGPYDVAEIVDNHRRAAARRRYPIREM